ncbi:AAA family ATPase [Brevundimonas sp.]|uniref:nucleotide-binding protein n=1 Tax=Brevundimonas sp. TaxID=1871086 RepID=UPI0025F5DCF4|nr:AAA family ATPase [Brevundimonas sp.]
MMRHEAIGARKRGPKTVAVISRKGGSGKTTIATSIAIGLSRRGLRTLLADTDPQGTATEVLKHRSAGAPSYRVSSGAKLYTLKLELEREGYDALVVDTPGVLQDEASLAISGSDLTLLVVRPSYLDLAAAAYTARLITQLRKPGLVVLNQAPPARGGRETSKVERALEALKLLQLPISPVIVHSRAAFQSSAERGLSVEETWQDLMAAGEIASLTELVLINLRDYASPELRGA